jgi:hypothetical protein
VGVDIAKRQPGHGQTLEVMTDRHVHGHADAAVELDAFLTDRAAERTDLNLGRRDA